MAKAAKKAAKKAAAKKPAESSLIKTISEVQAMNEKDQKLFRDSGGTTINNPN